MRTAFKEWATVDEALGVGAQTLLLRKGGIHEHGGRFQVEHEAFLIYPTYLHQSAEALKPSYRAWCRDDRVDAATVPLRHLVRVVDVLQAPPEPESAARWDGFHVYSPELIRKRYDYKPDRPLFVLIVRAYRLAVPVRIVETPRYAGCRSWVDLDEDIDVQAAEPIRDEAAFAEQTAQIRAALSWQMP
jgi:hypothetical protein